MDATRKLWNEQQQALRTALASPSQHQKAIELFLSQHAMVHSSQMAQAGLWSFDDILWEGVEDTAARTIPSGEEHSIVWIYWHLSRIEDVTMNLLIAGTPQVLHSQNWQEPLATPQQDTGNALTTAEIATLSAEVNLSALRSYRIAVGWRTREIVSQLQPWDIKRRVESARLERIVYEGAVRTESRGLLEYWGSLTVAGLLLMPPTRHNFVHLNEAARLKRRVNARLPKK